jgi:hypothetical protein
MRRRELSGDRQAIPVEDSMPSILRFAAGPALALFVTLWASAGAIETVGPPAPVRPN